MLNVTLETWLKSVHGDDYLLLNIHQGKKRVFFGYEDKVPEEIKKMIIDKVYIDFPDEALGIEIL